MEPSHLVLSLERGPRTDIGFRTTGLRLGSLDNDRSSGEPVLTLGFSPGQCNLAQVTVSLVLQCFTQRVVSDA